MLQNFFPSPFNHRQNKLECLSLENIFSIFQYFKHSRIFVGKASSLSSE
jgi:hypothetical protein